jgi:hypothetical protein
MVGCSEKGAGYHGPATRYQSEFWKEPKVPTQQSLRDAKVVLRRRPIERHSLARPFLQRGVIGLDRLLQPHRAALAFPRPPKCDAKIVLRRRPIERHALARPFLQRGVIGLGRLLQPHRAALALPKPPKCEAKAARKS